MLSSLYQKIIQELTRQPRWVISVDYNTLAVFWHHTLFSKISAKFSYLHKFIFRPPEYIMYKTPLFGNPIHK
jgi:hypothetical protein